MKELLILSGKGGTGKTTIAGAFIQLSQAKAYADCDVDAPNLHLVMNQLNEAEKKDFYGLPVAEIDSSKCIECDLCRQTCRFGAIYEKEGYHVDVFSCEGCGVCQWICPAEAVEMKPDIAGELICYKDNQRVFSTAQLKMGRGTSGLLVTEVKKQMRQAKVDSRVAIIDGSPGIGCPVIASITGTDMVLIVAEPSLSGISDMERIIQTVERFQTKLAVCINKADTNITHTEKIESFCNHRGIPLVGRIPFDPEAVKAINNGLTIVEVDCSSGRAAKKAYQETIKILGNTNKKTT